MSQVAHSSIVGRRMRLGMSLFVLTLVFSPVHASRGAQGGAEAPVVRVVARSLQPGEVVRVDVVCRCPDAAPRVTLGDGDVPLRLTASAAGAAIWQGFAGLDVDAQPGASTLVVHDPQSEAWHTEMLRVAPKQFAVRRLQVAPAFVDPPADELARIVREAATLDRIFGGRTPRPWSGAYVAPVAARATANFGARSVFNGEPRNPHAGVDFGSPTGTAVVAPGPGRIALAEALFFTGNTVVIDHGLGLYSLLAHLSVTTVRQGDDVERGALVGRVGATGRVTGPHLHWGVRLNGARVDPLSLLFATQARGPSLDAAAEP